MAVRAPTSLVTNYSDRDCYPRQPIVTTHYDLALDNQQLCLRNPKLSVGECFFPVSVTNPGDASFTEVWRTNIYGRHKAGVSYGGGTIGRLAFLLYETTSVGAVPTSGSYDIRITDGTNTDTLTVSSGYTTTGAWRVLAIANCVHASSDMSSATDLTVEIGNFVTSGIGIAFLCGVYILDND